MMGNNIISEKNNVLKANKNLPTTGTIFDAASNAAIKKAKKNNLGILE